MRSYFYVVFSACLISLSMMPCMLSGMAGIPSFSWLHNFSLCVCVWTPNFLYSCVYLWTLQLGFVPCLIWWFSHDYIGIMSLGKKDHRSKMPFTSHHIKGTHCWHDVSLWMLWMLVLITWLSYCVPDFSTVSLPCFLSFHVPIGRKSLCAAHRWRAGSWFHLTEGLHFFFLPTS